VLSSTASTRAPRATHESQTHAPPHATPHVALLATSSLQGCYGSFQLTGSLYEWNGRVTRNAFVQQLLFWGLCIIPVYELALVGDAIIFNLLEF
jgi:hypothetical protein